MNRERYGFQGVIVLLKVVAGEVKELHLSLQEVFNARDEEVTALVDKDEYLVTLSRYMHPNPVRAGIAQKPEDYRWASYRFYRDKSNKDKLVDVEDTLSRFSERRAAAVEEYRAFVEEGIGGGGNSFNALGEGIILGGKSFMKKVKGILGQMKADEEIPHIKKLRASIN